MTAQTQTLPAIAQGIPHRTFQNWTTPRGELATRNLEEVRDALRSKRANQDPKDFTRTPSQVHVTFGGAGAPTGTGRATVRFMDERGLGEPMVLTHHALRALGREILPTRGLDFLLDEIALGEQGRRLADMSFALFTRGKIEPRMFRTALTQDGGRIVRALRSLHSTDYAPYDNLEFVEDLLAGGYDSYPLVSITESDASLRFRFLDTTGVDMANLDGQGHGFRDGSHVFLKGADGKSGIPMPMFECWNSEVGLRAVTIRSGMFRLICTNSAHSVEDGATWRWVHRGDRERIREGVKGCMTEARVKSAGVVKAYETALETSIDDAYEWFTRAAQGEDLTNTEKEAVKVALTDPTTTPGGLLASVVDAVTLTAQAAIDEFEQERIELVGSKLLRRGLGEALANGGKLAA